MMFQFKPPAKNEPVDEPEPEIDENAPTLDDVIYSISEHSGLAEVVVKNRIAEKVAKNRNLVTTFGAAMMIIDAANIPVIKRPPPVSQAVPANTNQALAKGTDEIPVMLKPIIEGIAQDFIVGVLNPMLERIEKKIDTIITTPVITPELIATLTRIDCNIRSIRDASDAEKLADKLEEKPAQAEPEKPASKKTKGKNDVK